MEDSTDGKEEQQITYQPIDYLMAFDFLLQQIANHYSIEVPADKWNEFSKRVENDLKTKYGIGFEDYVGMCEQLQEDKYIKGEREFHNRITIKGRLLLLNGGYKKHIEKEHRQQKRFWIPIFISILSAIGIVVTASVNYSKMNEKEKDISTLQNKIERIEKELDSCKTK